MSAVRLGDRATLSRVETLVGVFIALQFPPGMLGHSWIPVQLALSIGGIGYMALRGPQPLARISLHPVRYFALIVLYLFVAHFVLEPESLMVGVKELLIASIGLAFIGTLFTAAKPRDIAVAFVLIHAALAGSGLLLLGARLLGVDRLLAIGYVPTNNYNYAAHWHFPFSFSYAQPISAGGTAWERFMGMYREPGVYQAFALSACATALVLRDLAWRRTLALLIAVASAFTLSTAWLGSFCAMAVWATITRVDFRRASSILWAVILCGAVVGTLIIAINIPGVGFSDKLAGESGQDRLRAFSALGPALTESPWWGLGQNTRMQRDSIESVSGSMIVGIARLGILGTAIFFLALVATILDRHDRRSLVVLIPIGVTMAASQPLYYSIAAYFVLALPGRDAFGTRHSEPPPPTPARRSLPPSIPLREPVSIVSDPKHVSAESHLPVVILDETEPT